MTSPCKLSERLREQEVELHAWYRALRAGLDPEERCLLADDFEALLDTVFLDFHRARSQTKCSCAACPAGER